jgi:hypothetical protein
MTMDCSSFRALCALESSGQLTDYESAILCEHCEHCILCREQLVAMRQLGMHLFLAQACKIPGKSLSKGVKERFAARADGQGIRFSSRSSTAGSPALGLVTMVLLLLSVITMTLRTEPSVENKMPSNFKATAGSHVDQNSSPIISAATHVQNRGIRNHHIHRNQTANLVSLQNRRFTFKPYLRSTFDPTSEIIKSPLDHLYETRTFHGTLELTAYSTPWKPDFKSMNPAFPIMQDLVP